MTNQDAITQLTAIVGQKNNEIDAINAAILVLTNGYQSDQAKIDAAAVAAQSAADTKVADLKALVASAIVSVQTSIQA